MSEFENCCPDLSVNVPINFGDYGVGTANRFFQRHYNTGMSDHSCGGKTFYPGKLPDQSVPLIQPQKFLLSTIPLYVPYPLPEFQHGLSGSPDPDRGRYFGWHHPEFPE